jgi:hypothetical protein
MPEQTELKRTRQHIATLYDALNGPGYVLTCKCKQWKARGKHQSHLREQHRAHRVEMGEWVKPRKEGPDWSDLREMARNAGWARHGSGSWSYWAYTMAHGGADDSRGWVVVQTNEVRRIEVVGSGKGPRTGRCFAELVDPTPAQVLAAARLVGLVGGVS